MASMSKIQIIGNVGRDAELRMTPGGHAVCEFSVAVNRKAQGKEETDWYRVSCWGKQAEIAQQYVRKGTVAFVSGRFSPRTYVDKSGANRVSYDIAADDFQMLGGKSADPEAPAFDPSEIPF